jgi:hypothetical protein
VHKVLNELLKEKIVDKIEKHYFLNKNWIKEQTDNFSVFYSHYFNTSYNPNQIDINNKIQVFRFTSVKEMLDFMILAYIQGELGTGELYASVKRLLPFIPHALIPYLKKSTVYILCSGNSIADQWTAKFYRTLGMQIKINAKPRHFNSICFGNCVVQYYFFMNENYRQKLYAFSEKIAMNSSMRLMKMTADLLYKNIEIFLVINRHPLLVEDMKKEIIAQF